MTTKKHPHRTMGATYLACIECGHGRGYSLHVEDAAEQEREGVRRAYELTYGQPMPESFGRCRS